MQIRFRSGLKYVGKSEQKVVTVVGFSPAACHMAVEHLRKGVPDLPVWLFSTTQPLSETAALCDSVYVHQNSLMLMLVAAVRLWPWWVAIVVGTWTGQHGGWPLKLAPFLISPFGTLLMNRHGDFFRATPSNILLHWRRTVGDAVRSGMYRCWGICLLVTVHLWRSGPVTRAKDVSRAIWLLIAHHIWRSGPVTRTRDVTRAIWLLVSYHVWRSGPVTRAKDLGRGFTLLCFATVLRWLSYPDRKLFKSVHGMDLLPFPIRPANDDEGFARFRPEKSRWDGAELERFARRSKARWILWQPHGNDEPVDDMLPLFEESRTFAVSRQVSVQPGNSGLFAMTAFRQLQPGEATQVLAPLSGWILVDRRLLLSVGIPNSSLPGTAWLLIFWKAAAAGLQSYNMGPRTAAPQLGPQPDLPIEERAFIIRVLSSRELRRLGRAQVELCGGNIGFMPALRGTAGRKPGRLKVLVVSPFLPYPLSHGGAVRIYNLCRALADRVDFTLVALREKGETVEYGKLHEIFREVYVVDRNEGTSADTRLPGQVRDSQSSSLTALLRKLAHQLNPDLIQIEYTHMAGFRESLPPIPTLLVEHDLTFSLYRQMADHRPSKASRIEYERWVAFERHWLKVHDGVWTVSADDRKIAIRESGRRPDRTFAIPNGVDCRRFVPHEAPASRPEILYVGSFRHVPNVLGFQTLCREVMPLVWKENPNVRLRVVAGPEYERHWKKNEPKVSLSEFDRRVEIHGFVEDLRPLYASASIVVIPLAVSAGTNIKVMEAMACGKAVVTTPVGCAGLDLEDGRDVLIRGDWEGFSNAACELLSEPSLRSGIGAQARRTVEKRFSWTAIADSAYQSYLQMTANAMAACAKA